MDNFHRTYTLKAGKMGETGFEIGNVDGVQVDCLHISFSIEKSSSKSPNDAKIQIWNLSPENVDILDTKDCIIELMVGYDSVNAVAIVGAVSSAETTNDNADRMTELSVVDGMVALRDTIISVSINGAVDSKTVYQMISDKMGLPLILAEELTFCIIPNGFSFIGKGKDALQKIADANGHSWTIQNQIIHITLPGRPIASHGFLLNSDSGLISIPKKISINVGTGTEKAVTGWEVEYLLNAAIGINDIVKVESKKVNGYFLVHKVTIDGDNLEGDWKCTAQLLEIKTG